MCFEGSIYDPQINIAIRKEGETMADFKRNQGESFEQFLRRFKKGLRDSGKLTEARKRKHHEKKTTKRKQKQRALIGKQIQKKREYLRKTGKLTEDSLKKK